MAEKQFVNGIIFKLPRDGAPDFVKMSGSMKRKELMEWLNGRSEEYVNFDIKLSSKGNLYCEVNTWKPNKDSNTAKSVSPDKNIPF